MNNETIIIDGIDYDVLSIDTESIKHITHARLAGGKVVDADFLRGFIHTYTDEETIEAVTTFTERELSEFGIQPLKLIERKPVEFVGEAVTVCQGSIDGKPGLHRLVEFSVPEDVWQHIEKGMKFQITEGESILKAKGVS